MLLTHISYYPFVNILQFIGNPYSFLGASIVCKEWLHAFNKNDEKLWFLISRDQNVRFDFSPKLQNNRVTRLNNNYMKYFMKAYQQKMFDIKERHDILLHQIKNHIECSKGDFPARLDNFINKAFPVISEFNVDWRCQTLEGNTIVTLITRGTERIKCLKLLIKKYKASIDIGDVGNFTPLIISSYYDNLLSVKLLIKYGANIYLTGKERSGFSLSAEHWAAIKHGMNSPIFQYLHSYRIKINKNNYDQNIHNYNLLANNNKYISSYCVCCSQSEDSMIACENGINCWIEWYHMACVNVEYKVCDD